MLEFARMAAQADSQEAPGSLVIAICHRIPLFAQCLERTLSAREGISCTLVEVSEALHGSEALLRSPPALLLLDAAIAAEHAELVARLRQHSPHCRVLLLVSEAATERLVGLTQCGSQGCVRENGSLDDLCTGIRQVLAGQCYFAPELANALFSQLNGCDVRQPWAPFVDEGQLTPREREVLRLIAWEDLGNKQIARRLHVSLYTVKNHVHNIIEKLGASDRRDAARQARRRNMIAESGNGDPLAGSRPIGDSPPR